MISLTFLPVRLTVSWIEALKKVVLSDSGRYYFSGEKLHFFHSFMWYLIEKLIQVWEKENIYENCTIFKSISNQISLCDRVPIQTLKTGSNLKKLIEQQKNNKSRKKYLWNICEQQKCCQIIELYKVPGVKLYFLVHIS